MKDNLLILLVVVPLFYVAIDATYMIIAKQTIMMALFMK